MVRFYELLLQNRLPPPVALRQATTSAAGSDQRGIGSCPGCTIGQAVRQARRHVRDAALHDPTWLAYSLYAHPNAYACALAPWRDTTLNQPRGRRAFRVFVETTFSRWPYAVAASS